MAAPTTGSTITHVAYSDESHHNVGRYRALALVSLRQQHASGVNSDLRAILQDSGAIESKWEKLRTAKYRFAALKLIEYAVAKAVDAVLRLDVLVWDTEDSRHKVLGRDDSANLQRMYYHLFRNVLLRRWPKGSVWRLCPDEQTAVQWETVADFVDAAGLSVEIQPPLGTPGGLRIRLRREFRVEEIVPCHSGEEPIAQVGDLFAGLAVYSRECYDRYVAWFQSSGPQQLALLPREQLVVCLSGADRERCPVLDKLNELCKRYKLGVSLESNCGLKTYDPRKPLNFWWYEPQHNADKAPTRG